MNKKTVKRTVNIIASERTRGERFRKCVNCRTRLAPKEGSKNLVYFCPKCGLHFNVRDTSPELKLGTAFGGVKNNGETGIVAQKTNNTNFKKSTNKHRKQISISCSNPVRVRPLDSISSLITHSC